jgi:hypothetical protein
MKLFHMPVETTKRGFGSKSNGSDCDGITLVDVLKMDIFPC